jgi:predicted MFS family arabinose efflux permease
MTNAKNDFARVANSILGWRSTHWLVLVIAVLAVSVLYAAFISGRNMLAVAEDQLRQTGC